MDPAFLAWSTSLPIDRRLLREDCRGSIAHVRGLQAAGILAQDEADRLIEALRTLPERVERGEVTLPDEEDVHMAVEAWLDREVGALAKKLHTGRSRNDQVATDLALWLRQAVEELTRAIDQAVAQADAWASRFGEVVMPSYTHRQVAIPTLGRIWIEGALGLALRRDRALLRAVERELELSPLGAGAVGGTTLPIDPRVAAADLGFAGPPRNPIDAVGSRDPALVLVFVCARTSLHLARFSADVVELASDGLVRLGGAIAGGSSMMPHKRNPDLFELVRGQAALRNGELIQLMTLFQGLGAGYHRDLQHDKQVVFAAVDGTLDGLRMIALSLDHLEPVEDAALQALRDGDAIATDLCEALVEGGMPFREAYGKIGGLVAAQRDRGKRLADLGVEDLVAAGLPASLHARLDLRESARRRAAKFGA